MVAGSSTARTSVASIRIAVDEADAELLHVEPREASRTREHRDHDHRGLVTTPAVSVMPCSTAFSVGTPRSHSSRMRLRMNTW